MRAASWHGDRRGGRPGLAALASIVLAGCALAGGLPLLGGCAGTELVAEARGIRGVVKSARDKGAYRCAPGELALAEAHVEFAEQELGDGDYFRAKDHLRIADWNAREALRLSSTEGCQVRRRSPNADSDGDGVNDGADRCGNAAEDRDGFQDEDGCPDDDNDGDGVLDGADRCPLSAEDGDGFQDQDGCPEPDNDGDGVSDALDRCPRAAEDRDGFEDEDGCADPDDDRDGVLDAEDRCPRQAGLRLAQGCPQTFSLIKVTDEKIEISQTIFFQSGKAVILPRSYPLLDEVAAALRSQPTLKVRIEGHTDSRGKRETNLRISQARADAVKAYLVGVGIATERLESRGFGPDQPIETNRTSAGRDRNRRVEFVITDR